MRFALLGLLIAGCTSRPTPTPTQAKCPDPDPGTLTWDNFGQKFMADFCTSCHDSVLNHSQRNGAPLYRDCPQPTEQQRMDLSVWLACEVDRPHTF
jgi:hypothetical protein